MTFRLFISALCLFVLSACGRDMLIPDGIFSTDTASEMSEKLVIIQSRDTDLILAQTIEQFRQIENVKEAVEETLQYLPKGQSSYELVTAQTNKSNINGVVSEVYTGTFELTNGEEYALVRLTLEKDSECCLIRAVNITAYETSPSRFHDWNWAGKAFTNYLMLGLAVFIPIFIFVTLIHCWRNHCVEKKWRWRLFILIGFYGLALNWSTGEISPNFININSENGSFNLSLLKFSLFGSGVTRASLLQPWIIEIGIPLGAILYWWKEKNGRFVVQKPVANPLL